MSRSHRVVVERRVHNECPKNVEASTGFSVTPASGLPRLGNF